MTTAEKLGRVIVELRRQKGVSQEIMSNNVQISRKYMSEIENGKSHPSIEVLEHIASYFDMTLSELFQKIEQLN